MNADQARAARAILKKGIAEIATLARVTPNTISRLENGSDPKQSTVNALKAVYEELGVMFIPQNGGGAGVRLRDRPNSENNEVLE